MKLCVNECKMDNDQIYRTSTSCSHCLSVYGVGKWALDGAGPQPEVMMRALEGHRQLLKEAAERRGVSVPDALSSPVAYPGGGDNGDAPTRIANLTLSCPVQVYHSYLSLLRRHLEALRQMTPGIHGDGDAASGSSAALASAAAAALPALDIVQRSLQCPGHDERSDDSGVSSSPSSSSSLSLITPVTVSKDAPVNEDSEECEEITIIAMEVRRTPGIADLDVKSYKYEEEFPLPSLQDEVRKHREFLTQIWSQRRMPPSPWQCHNGESDTALSPFKGAARPMQITDQQLREGAEAVLRALDEALEQTLTEEIEERRRAKLARQAKQERETKKQQQIQMDPELQQQELQLRHNQLHMENQHLKEALRMQKEQQQQEHELLQKQLQQQQRQQRQLQEELDNHRARQSHKLRQRSETFDQKKSPLITTIKSRDRDRFDNRQLTQTSQTFINLTEDAFSVTSNESKHPQSEEQITKDRSHTRWTTRKYLERLAQIKRKEPHDKDTSESLSMDSDQTCDTRTFTSKTTILDNDISERTYTRKMKEKGYYTYDTTRSGQSEEDTKEINDSQISRSQIKRQERKIELTSTPTEVVRHEKNTPLGSGQLNSQRSREKPREKSPSHEDTQRRKVRSQSVCLPYSHLSTILQAKVTSVKRSLSAGAQSFHRVMVALPRRILSSRSRTVSRRQNWYKLGENEGYFADESSTRSIIPAAWPPSPCSRGSEGSGRSFPCRHSPPRVQSRSHRRSSTTTSTSPSGIVSMVASPRATPLTTPPVTPPATPPPYPSSPSAHEQSFLTLRVEAPPASGRRLQQHLARLAEPDPRELPTMQVEVHMSGGAIGPPMLLGQSDAASFYASLLECTSAMATLPPASLSKSCDALPIATTISSTSSSGSRSLVERLRRGPRHIQRLPWAAVGSRGKGGVGRGSSGNRETQLPVRRSVSQPLLATLSSQLPPPLLPPAALAATTSHLLHGHRTDGPFAEVWALYRRLLGMVRRLRARRPALEGVHRQTLRGSSTSLSHHTLLAHEAVLGNDELGERSNLVSSAHVRQVEEEDDDRVNAVGLWRGTGHLWLQGYLSLFALLCVLYPWQLGTAYGSDGTQ